MSIQAVTRASWDAEVVNSEKPVLVYFWAPWCGPCKMTAIVMEKLAETMPETKFVRVNVDEEPLLAEDYQVEAIPLVMLSRNRCVIRRCSGFRTEEYMRTWLKG